MSVLPMKTNSTGAMRLLMSRKPSFSERSVAMFQKSVRTSSISCLNDSVGGLPCDNHISSLCVVGRSSTGNLSQQKIKWAKFW